jgi:flagellar basal-body rod protein FlgF
VIRGIYSAATALSVAAQTQDVIAHNLAHLNVPGYRHRGVAFATFDPALSPPVPANTPTGTRVATDFHDFQPGALQMTGAPLDLALTGDGFFVLQGPDGPVYTRDGVFERNAQGQLQNKSGLPVLGANGPITVPATATDVTISEDGTVRAGGQQLGQLQQVRFADPRQLERVGTTLFRAPPGAQQGPGTGTMLQGYRESSNVQAAGEMVAMIRGTRYFEAAQRALRTLSDAIQLNTRAQ